MKVVHFSQFAPNMSGLYESTKDQIKYERRLGVDSHAIDPFDKSSANKKDDWLEYSNWKDAYETPVWVVHAGLPPPLNDYIKDPKNRAKHVLVSILHGPVEHMMFKEYTAALRGLYDEEEFFTRTHINMIWLYDKCVVINQHEYDVSVLYDENNTLIYIPNSIDLERIEKDATPWPYANRPAVVVADYPRFEKFPAHVIFAMPRVIDKLSNARLSVLSLPFENIEFWRNIFHRSKNWHLLRKCVENLHIKGGPVMPYFRGADIMFNSNFSGINSRVQMEAMAMGVPIVSYNGEYTKFHAKIFDLQSIADNIIQCWEELQNTDLKQQTIDYAYKNFDRGVYAKQYVEMYNDLLREKDIGKEV